MAVEGFLGRWSRRKRDADRGVEQKTDHDVERELREEPPAGSADPLQSPAALQGDVGSSVAGPVGHPDPDAGSSDGNASGRTADAGAQAAPAARADAMVQSRQAAPGREG